MRYSYYLLITGFLLFIACKSKSDFPAELVQFTSYPQNPVFKGTASPSDWDEIIRERGYILKEDDTYHLWYTGYKDTTGAVMSLGYATSPDGLIWTRYAGNPIYDSLHTEDMMIIKVDDTYQMFAEGNGDIAHRLVSTNRIHWQDHAGSGDSERRDSQNWQELPIDSKEDLIGVTMKYHSQR